MKSMTMTGSVLSMMLGSGNAPLAGDFSGGMAKSRTELPQSSSVLELLDSQLQQAASSHRAKAQSTREAGNWFTRMLDRMDEWGRQEDIRLQEAYLAESTDLCDLEARLRRLDDAGAARGHALY